MQQTQQQSSSNSDLLPSLIQLPLQQQASACTSQDQNSNFKKENGDSQQTLITAVMIPSSSEGSTVLSQAATAQILQDNQHLICSAANTSTSSAIGRAIKTSHIQVLVMPPSTTVSVTTSPEPLANNSQLNLKSEGQGSTLSELIHNCNSQDSQQRAQNEVKLHDITSDCNIQGSQFQRNNLSQNYSNVSMTSTNFSNLDKEAQTLRELQMQGASENEQKIPDGINEMILYNEKPNISCGNMGLETSIQSGLARSLESIPIQSLIQNSENNSIPQTQTASLMSQFNEEHRLRSNSFSGKLMNDSACHNVETHNSLSGSLESMPLQSLIQNSESGIMNQKKMSQFVEENRVRSNSFSGSRISHSCRPENIQTVLERSFDSFPLQSLIQNSKSGESSQAGSSGLQVRQFTEQNLVHSNSFVDNTMAESRNVTINQKISEISRILDNASNLRTVLQMESSISNQSQDNLSAVVTGPGGFNIVSNHNSQQNISLPDSRSFENSVNTYFNSQANLLQKENSTDASGQNTLYSAVANSESLLGMAFTGSNQGISDKTLAINSFGKKIQEVSVASENQYSIVSAETIAPSLGKVLSLPESQVLNFTDSFQTSFVSTLNNSCTTVSTTAATTDQTMNLQDFKLPLTISTESSMGTEPTAFSFQDTMFNKNIENDVMNQVEMCSDSKAFVDVKEEFTARPIMTAPELVTSISSGVTKPNIAVKQDFIENSIQSNISVLSIGKNQSNPSIGKVLSQENPVSVTFASLNPKVSTSSLFLENSSIGFSSVPSTMLITESCANATSTMKCLQKVLNNTTQIDDMGNASLKYPDLSQATSRTSELAQPNQYPQGSLQPVSGSQPFSETFTKGPEASLPEVVTTSNSTNTNNIQPSGPSIEQMSTMMSLMPESELLKFINPSTFDKM